MKEDSKYIITGIDIGTTKIAVVIAEWVEDEPITILGVGQSPSHGLKKGVVSNINQTVESIKAAVEKAETQSGIKVDSAYVSITGDHIKGINNTGVITVSKNNSRIPSDQEITSADVKRVLEHAKSITLPLERRILHVLSQEFKVDNHTGIDNPLGMTGHRLEARVHLVTSAITTEKNLATCMEKVEIDVIEFVLEPLASSFAVLDPNEKNLGVALLDIGGGTTDVIVYYDGGVHHTGVIPYGGDNITYDIAHGVQTTLEQAEMLKCQYGSAKEALSGTEETITISGIGDRESRTISQRELASFIEPRMKEILTFSLSEIRKSNYRGTFTFGIVLTGGGALLNNVTDLAQEIFHQPVKIGKPLMSGGISETVQDPIFSTVVGLIHYAIDHWDDRTDEDKLPMGLSFFTDIFYKIKKFFRNLY